MSLVEIQLRNMTILTRVSNQLQLQVLVKVIPHTPMIVIASSQERSHYHAQDFFVDTVLTTLGH